MSNARSGRPNVVFIHAESMDGRKMGCMGDPSMQRATKNLDKLAAEGVLFTNAYTPCPVCVPSRASMWSGTYPHDQQCWNNYEGLKDDVPTFMSHLAAAGYATKAIGPLDYAWGAHSIRDRVGSWTRAANIHRPLCRTPLPQVVEQGAWNGDKRRVAETISWLESTQEEQRPFMLYLTTDLVHPPFTVEQKYMDLVDADKLDLPPEDKTDHPVLRYQRALKNVLSDPPEWLVRKIRHVYGAMIATLDDLVGQVIDTLDRLGLRESTYIIFSSDHGEMDMEHGQILKYIMYEPATHVPMIISGPGVRNGASVETPVSLVDIFPTLMGMTGTEKPDYLVGESLMPQLTGEKSRKRDWAFAEYHGDRCNTGTFMLVRGSWKYIKYVGYQPLLFNLKEDPWELHNRASTEDDVVAEMEGILARFIDCDAVDSGVKAYDKANFAKWRAEQKAAGTYDEIMSTVYSGFDRLCIEDIKPWTKEDEAQIEAWLSREE